MSYETFRRSAGAPACHTCGAPIEQAPGMPSNRRYCGRSCKDAATYLAAAERCILAIVAGNAEAGPLLRARLRGMANKMGNDWRRPRGAGGRFLRKEGQ